MKLARKAMKAMMAKAMKKAMKATAMKKAMKAKAMKAKAMQKAMKAKTAALAPAMKAMNAKQVEDAICIEELLAVLEIMPAVLLQWSIHSRAAAQLRCQAGQLDASVECCVRALQFLIYHRHIDVDKGMVLMV